MPSIIAATLLVIPVFVAAASMPRPAFGDDPKLVFTSGATSMVAGDTSTVITVERQNADTTGALTVYLTAATGHFVNEFTPATITSVEIAANATSANFRYYGTHAPTEDVTAADEASGPDTGLFDATETIIIGPAGLDHFDIDTIGDTQTAGTAFTVTATAYDAYGNKKTDYAGGATVSSSTLTASPGFPPAAGTSPSYGSFPAGTWTTGTKSAQVTAFKAEASANQSVTVSDVTASVAKTSNLFKVVPADPSSIVFSDAGVSFNGEPYDTKKDTPIYSNCVPTATGTPPCNASTSTRVKVLVRDAWGNPVADGKSITISAALQPGSASLGGDKTAMTTGGIATFGAAGATHELVVTPTGTTGSGTFTARLTGTTGTNGLPVTSRTFQLVDDLEVCATSSCDNFAKALAYGRIAAGTSGAGFAATSGTLDGVTLTTQQVAPLAHCIGQSTQFGSTTDVRVQGFGVTTLRPKFTVALIVPKTTLNDKHATSRNAGSFNICLGTTWDGGGDFPPGPSNSTVPVWQQKKVTSTVPTLAQRDTSTSPNTYWGWLLDCKPSLPSTNPCIDLRTKDASVLQSYLKLNNTDFAKLGFKSGDLVIVYLTQTPWDAKGSVF